MLYTIYDTVNLSTESTLPDTSDLMILTKSSFLDSSALLREALDIKIPTVIAVESSGNLDEIQKMFPLVTLHSDGIYVIDPIQKLSWK